MANLRSISTEELKKELSVRLYNKDIIIQPNNENKLSIEEFNINNSDLLFKKLDIIDPELIKFINDNIINLEIVTLKKYPNSFFYFKDEECIIAHNLDYGSYVSINNELIWEIFKIRFKLDFSQSYDLLKNIIYYFYNIEKCNISRSSIHLYKEYNKLYKKEYKKKNDFKFS